MKVLEICHNPVTIRTYVAAKFALLTVERSVQFQIETKVLELCKVRNVETALNLKFAITELGWVGEHGIQHRDLSTNTSGSAPQHHHPLLSYSPCQLLAFRLSSFQHVVSQSCNHHLLHVRSYRKE